jgi:hypothetical protein
VERRTQGRFPIAHLDGSNSPPSTASALRAGYMDYKVRRRGSPADFIELVNLGNDRER